MAGPHGTGAGQACTSLPSVVANRSTTPTLTSLWSTSTAATTSDSPSTSNASDGGTALALHGGSDTAGAPISSDLQSSSDSDSDQGTSQSFSYHSFRQPPHKRRKKQKLCF